MFCKQNAKSASFRFKLSKLLGQYKDSFNLFFGGQEANPVLVVYSMAVVEMELRLRFPHHNVGVVSRQNGPLHKAGDALELCDFNLSISIYFGTELKYILCV
jgi:hypothetical protein